ncbi:MAG: DUF3869 domain-containing protein [Prevotella sp.]|jgi:hypothetical protein|nr:DUF3869 domain-containing protein [Prevotella sp.]
MRSKILNFKYGTKSVSIIILAICSAVFTGCYERENIIVTIPEEMPPAEYWIAGVVTDYNSGGALKNAKVQVDDDSETPVGNYGEFSIKISDDAPKTSGYTVKFSCDGYVDAVRRVYISSVVPGLISIVTVNAALTQPGTTATPPPPAINISDEEKTLSDEEKENAANKIKQEATGAEKLAELENSITENVPEDIKQAVGEVIVETPTITPKDDGSLEISTQVKFSGNGVTQEDTMDMTYTYNSVSGFQVVDDLEEIDKPQTKAAGDKITDASVIVLFEAAVANTLNMSKGFANTPVVVSKPIPSGKKVVGYNIVNIVKTEKYVFLINGIYICGPVAVYTVSTLEPVYEDLPADTHGARPNAGGGSGN